MFEVGGLTIRENEKKQHAEANCNHTLNQEEPVNHVQLAVNSRVGSSRREEKQTNHCQPDKPCRPFMPLNP